MRRFQLLFAAGLIALVTLALAGAYAVGLLPISPGLPPLPRFDPGAFAPNVRQQVEDALAAARADRENPEAVGELGMVLHAYDELAAAAVAYERARNLDPESFRWLYYRGRALVRSARVEEGLEVLRAAAALRPQYAPLWIELGDLLLTQGKPKEAILHYDTALEHDPRSAIGLYGLGQALKAQGDAGAAAEKYRRALELAPRFACSNSLSGAVPLDSWTHVVMTFDDSGDRQVHLYVDGAEVSYAAQSTASGTLAGDAPFSQLLGRRQNGSRPFAGFFDEMRIYDTVLDLCRIEELAEVPE